MFREEKIMAKYNSDQWIGKKYGMLTVVEPVHVTLKNGGKQWFWRVKCECGNESITNPHGVIHGKCKSCGCLKTKGPPTTHRESHTPLHNIRCGMNNRCNPTHKSSKGYGKRGITICDEWRNYESFAQWARENGYEDGLTIERIDVNGNYCPDNCTWITHDQQARNRRTTHWVVYNGAKMSLAEACEKAGLPYKQVFERIAKRGWTVDKALSTPIRKMKDRSEWKTKSA